MSTVRQVWGGGREEERERERRKKKNERCTLVNSTVQIIHVDDRYDRFRWWRLGLVFRKRKEAMRGSVKI